MNISEAKIRFDAGEFNSAQVAPGLIDEWHLILSRNKSNISGVTITRQRGGIAIYKSVEGAVNAAKSIGFRRVEVFFL